MILNDQNEAQVRDVVAQAMGNRDALDAVRAELAAARANVEKYEGYERDLERTRDEFIRQIRSLGFHDIGHARTELQGKEKP